VSPGEPPSLRWTQVARAVSRLLPESRRDMAQHLLNGDLVKAAETFRSVRKVEAGVRQIDAIVGLCEELSEQLPFMGPSSNWFTVGTEKAANEADRKKLEQFAREGIDPEALRMPKAEQREYLAKRFADASAPEAGRHALDPAEVGRFVRLGLGADGKALVDSLRAIASAGVKLESERARKLFTQGLVDSALAVELSDRIENAKPPAEIDGEGYLAVARMVLNDLRARAEKPKFVRVLPFVNRDPGAAGR
jgi:hypothetical protein